MEWKIQLSELNYGIEEIEATQRVIASEWLTAGPLCQEFEANFTSYIDHPNEGVFVSSATAGLHLILMQLGIKHGDEVIVPALTFVSDANVVKQLGATPVFADINGEHDLNCDFGDILKKITKRTKAIVIVHFAGFPMDIKNLNLIAKQKGIAIIEDCAHSPGASINNTKCGTLGDYSFFSFFSNKNLAVGEGGMVFCKNKAAIDKIRLMRSHGMNSVTLDRHLGRTMSYDIECVGLNYRPDEIRAALGVEQLKKLDAANAKRGKLAEQYRKNLARTSCVVPFSKQMDDTVSAYHIMPVILPCPEIRAKVHQHLKDSRVQSSIHYPSFSSFTEYKKDPSLSSCKVAERVCSLELTLPLHPRMEIDEVNFITDKVCEVI